MLLLGIDLETSGLDYTKDRIVEIGAVLFDWDTKTPVQLMSELIDPTMDLGGHEFPLAEEVISVTGITDQMLGKYGAHEKDVLQKLETLAQFGDYRVGHNCNMFDSLFMTEAYKRFSLVEPSLPWLDTMTDIKFPESIKTRNLKHLAAEHDFLPGFSHRAVFDVMTMFRVMSHYDLDAMIARSQEPTLYVQALVSFDEKEFAKARGYHWFAAGKIWWRSWKQSDYEADRQECGFSTRLLEAAPE
jgi:DNA polymerase III subunit epsilon